MVGPLSLSLMAYYGSYLKDVLPGSIYVSFGGETSHDHCMKLGKLKWQTDKNWLKTVCSPSHSASGAQFVCMSWVTAMVAVSHLLTSKQDRTSSQTQFQIGRCGLPQLTGSRCEVQNIIHQLQDKTNHLITYNYCAKNHYWYLLITEGDALLNSLYLKCNANILPILVRYFMHFRIRVYQNGNLKWKSADSQRKKH